METRSMPGYTAVTPAAKNCISCPNALNDTEAAKLFGKSTGTSVCYKYGNTLSMPGIPTVDRKLGEYFAERCDSHGDSRVAQPKLLTLHVFDKHGQASSIGDGALPNKLPSCKSCQNYITPQGVSEIWGYPTGVCAATGRLLLDNRLTYEAKDCNLGFFGPVDSAAVGLLQPIEPYNNAPETTSILFVHNGTDMEVSDDDSKRGVESWKRIDDPRSTGRFVMLPVFGDSAFTERQQELIPRTGDDERPEWYVDHQSHLYTVAVLWFHLDETPALWGQAGTGKTEFFRHIAWAMRVPFRRISVTGSTEVEDLAGKMMYEQGRGTYFQRGRLSNAWAEPGVLVLDEPNVGPPDVWQFIRPLTDNSKQLVLDMNEGERILRNENAFLGLAMNPAWDVRNVGAGVIGDADGSRLMHIFMDLPPESIEIEIIKQRCSGDGFDISKDQLNMVMKVAKDIRSLCDDDTLPITWGVRPQIKVARALAWFEPIDAYRLAAADYLEPAQQEHLLDAVRSHVK